MKIPGKSCSIFFKFCVCRRGQKGGGGSIWDRSEQFHFLKKAEGGSRSSREKLCHKFQEEYNLASVKLFQILLYVNDRYFLITKFFFLK